jgi:SET domain-containing protein
LEYKGRIISDEEAEAKRQCTQYMFDVKKGKKIVRVIDGARNRYASAGKYVNSTPTYNDRKRNAEFVQYKMKIYIVATKRIRSGHEILVYYGEDTNRIINR